MAEEEPFSATNHHLKQLCETQTILRRKCFKQNEEGEDLCLDVFHVSFKPMDMQLQHIYFSLVDSMPLDDSLEQRKQLKYPLHVHSSPALQPTDCLPYNQCCAACKQTVWGLCF